MTPDELNALINHIEGYTNPRGLTEAQARTEERELADRVLLACGWQEMSSGNYWEPAVGQWWPHHLDRPNPLTSVDDAMLVVPEGWRTHSTEQTGTNSWVWILAYYDDRSIFAQNKAGGSAETPARALTLAALKARLEMMETENG